MKIAWMSNSPAIPSGYGKQTALVLPQLRDAGHDVAVVANFGQLGTVGQWDGFTVYPQGYDPWSNDVILNWTIHHLMEDPGWLITLYDVWGIKDPRLERLNMASWVPIDHDPAPPAVVQWFKQFKSVPIAMSRFGETQLREAGLDPLYVPHAVDTNVFQPIGDAREQLGLDPDRFIVGMVAANKQRLPDRKSFAVAFEAFAELLRTVPDALLYVHSESDGLKEGLDLNLLARACAIPDRNIMFPDQFTLALNGYTDPIMARIYSAFDVMVAPSMGEGFCVPLIEAQACGVPVIVSDWTAQPELVGAGQVVPGLKWWNPIQCSWLLHAATPAVHMALLDAYEQDCKAALGDQARQFALGYDVKTVFDTYWQPVLAELESRLPSTVPLTATPV